MIARIVIALTLVASTVGATSFPIVSRYALDISFDPARSAMSGTAGIYFAGGQTIDSAVTFFLHGELTVDSVLQSGRTVKSVSRPGFYYYDYSLIAVKTTVSLDTLAPRDSLTVFYHGFFNPSKARSPSDYMRIDPSGVLLRAFWYSPWFPVFATDTMPSYAATFKPVVFRIPEQYQLVFVGTYLVDTILSGQRISPWSAENLDLSHAQISAQRWKLMRRDGLYTFYYPDNASASQALKILNYTDRLLAAYRNLYDRSASAPEHYVLELPQYGDISSANVTGLSEGSWQQFEENIHARRALAHELVHQFVDARVPEKDSLYALAKEGFPSYFHLPVLAGIVGQDWYNNYMEWVEQTYLDKKRSGTDGRGNPLPPEKPLLAITAAEIGKYKDEFILSDRALLFLNWMRRQMGQKSFGNFCRQLFSGSAYSARPFERLCEKYLPMAKDDIHLWLYTNEFPDRLRIKPSKGK
ncbi:MAG: hypothetical protein HY851_08005 [candidate division Zixibacteria bacterium]|nr:hypothetical protein [candidate division Zixibacteria bacterium]